MALKRNERYPGRFSNPTGDNPQGAFKNRTSPTSQDGSYLEADWANDWDGFFARILNAAGVSPNGILDTGTSSQIYDALMSSIPGRLINRTVFTSNATFTPDPRTKAIIVEVQGGGGGGGGVGASSGTTVSCGTGGAGGGYAKSYLTSGFSGASIVVGAAGLGGNLSPTDGTAGGNSSFGTTIVANGGAGGHGQGQAQPPFTSTGTLGGVSTGGNVVNVRGTNSSHGVAVSLLSVAAGSAGGSVLGYGGFSPANNGVSPQPGTGYGGGGGSSYTNNLSGFSGAAGSPGCVIVWEYS